MPPPIPFEVDPPSGTVAEEKIFARESKSIAPVPSQPAPPDEPEQVWSVSDLTRSVRLVLEGRFRAVTVQGELSNVRQAGSGHWYFVLKDEQAQLRGVLFRQVAQRLSFHPEEGMSVWARGSLQVYEQRGEYQLSITGLEPRGTGALQLAFEQLRQRLQLEGLFNSEHKRRLPFLPRCIGAVTSPTGAVIQDMRNVLWRRFPGMRLVLYPALVQGNQAAASVREGIEWFNRYGHEQQVDVLIIGRGGGSLEDLWAFNEELLVRAIHTSELPIVSAVGHETDFTIADFVADLRAPTPSAAIEMVVPRREELEETLEQNSERLQRLIRQQAQNASRMLQERSQRLRSPQQAMVGYRNQILELQTRLMQQQRQQLQTQQLRMKQLQERLKRGNPHEQVKVHREQCTAWKAQLQHHATQRLKDGRKDWQALSEQLQALSPLAVLQRGYSLTVQENGQTLRSVTQIQPGQRLRIQLPDGDVETRVEKVHSATKPWEASDDHHRS